MSHNEHETGRFDDLVPHPRFGKEPRLTGARIDERTLRDSFWRLQHETFFPETAVEADISKQERQDFPMPWYVDILKTCCDCQRRFIFFAQEQRHWYEELGFKLDADCVRCAECRKDDQQRRAVFDRYSQNVVRQDLSDEQLRVLLADAVWLWNEGLLSDPQRLRRLKNLGRTRVPSAEETAVIVELCAALP